MTGRGRLRGVPALLASLALVAGGAAAGCGRSEAGVQATAGREVEALELASIPPELLGLEVRREDVADTVARVDSAFVDGLALYSLRRPARSEDEGDLVQATLQVSRFHQGARFESDDFRQAVVNQIGSSRPRAFRLGTHTVYLTTGTRQSIAVWFSGRHMFVLASRADYDQPRTLLRRALELRP